MNKQQHNLIDPLCRLERKFKRAGRFRRNARKGSVELEAVLITGLMFPLAVALYYMAIRGFAMLYKLIAAILEWPYL